VLGGFRGRLRHSRALLSLPGESSGYPAGRREHGRERRTAGGDRARRCGTSSATDAGRICRPHLRAGDGHLVVEGDGLST